MAAARAHFNLTSTATPMGHQSPWHSPIPYLFGGLAAMLGLVAFALLILACSYWKLSGRFGDGDDNSGVERDLEAGEGESGGEDQAQKPPVLDEKIVVIMAGEVQPTFLATPTCNRSSSGSSSSSSSSSRTSSFGNWSYKSGIDENEVLEGERKQGSNDQTISHEDLENQNSSSSDHTS